jgi:pimeloyl-ACP methyl ester carboxylesterase
MFNFLNNWKTILENPAQDHGKLPEREKVQGEKAQYIFSAKSININGLNIAYIDEGDPDANVLLMIHGMGGGIPVWDKNIKDLRKGNRCIALDLPGHGLSSKGDLPFSMDFYVEIVSSFIKELGLKGLSLVGHSMGGQIAFLTALKEKQLIERLILVSPAGLEPYTAMEKQMLINLSALTVASGNAFTQHKMNYMIGFRNDFTKAAELSSSLAFYKEDGADFGKMMLRSIEGMLLGSVDHLLEDLTQPCLILLGRQDYVSPYQYLHGEKYVDTVATQGKRIRDVKITIFPSCGHFLQYEKSKQFNKEVSQFLKQPGNKH